jgi:predicted DsbA family dithiol-disulfide isomerase
MQKPTLVLVLPLAAAAAAGCTRADSRLDQVVAAPPPTSAPAASLVAEPAAAGGSTAERLARVEAKLDKIVTFLDANLPPQEPAPDQTYSVAVAPIDPVQGPSDAKVTIVEGFEFLCPYCFMVNPTVDQLLAKYPKDVRLVSKYLIIHGPSAVPPGLAACAAAKQGKYPQMKAAMWSHLFKLEDGKPKMQGEQIAPDSMAKIATEIGLDAARFKADSESEDCQGWLQGSASAMHPLGASGTPAFFINGRYLSGAQPLEAFDKVIHEELAKADKAIADGISAADYYQSAVVAKGIKKVKGRFED